MSFTFVQATLCDFGPFANAVVPFAQPGLTVVEGVVEGCPGFDSNGAGKSFLLDAVPYALYGRCLRPKYAGDKVIRRGAVSAKVELIMDVDGQVVSVTRYRKDVEMGDRVAICLAGSDITAGTNAESDALIVRLLGGMDFQAFTNSIAFGARDDVTSFFAATDSERKDILERLLVLDVFGRAEEIARVRLDAARTARATAVTLRDRLDAALAAHRQALGSVQARTPEVEDMRFEVHMALAKAQHAQRQSRIAEGHVAQCAAILVQTRNAFATQISIERKAREKYEAADHAWRSKEAQLQAEITAFERTADTVKRRQDSFVKLSSAVCPTCQQAVEAEHCAAILANYAAERDDALHKATATELELAEWRQSPRPTPPPASDRRSLDAAQSALDAAQSDLRAWEWTAQERAATAGSMDKRVRAAIAAQEHAQHAIESVQAELDRAHAAVGAATTQEDRCAFWVAGFGNQGIKSFLIESELAEINRRCGVYVSRLLGQGAKVWMTATRALKSGRGVKEEIVVHADIPGKTVDYHGGSKGQKRRMDLCVLLALRDLVSSRNAHGCNQLFVDEIFDGVDDAGCDAVVDLLRDMVKVGPILLITHRAGVRRAADAVLTVTHHGEHATAALTRP